MFRKEQALLQLNWSSACPFPLPLISSDLLHRLLFQLEDRREILDFVHAGLMHRAMVLAVVLVSRIVTLQAG